MNAADVDLRLLTSDERRAVGMAASAAFLKMCQDDPGFLPLMLSLPGNTKTKVADDWRHGQIKSLTEGRAAGASEMTLRDFDAVMGRLADLAGQPVKAFTYFLRAEPPAGRAAADGDTQAARDEWLRKIYTDGPRLGFNEGWRKGYVRRVFKKSFPDECTAAELKAVLVTMRSRFFAEKRKAAAAV